MKISLKEDNYLVIDKSENLLSAFINNLMTAVMLAFCVYISQDSTWWTFVSGLMFIFWFFCVISSAFKKRVKSFSSWAEFKAWVDEQAKEEAES